MIHLQFLHVKFEIQNFAISKLNTVFKCIEEMTSELEFCYVSPADLDNHDE